MLRKKRLLGANENSKEKTSKLLTARENAGDQVVIGFNFASDWLREWYEFLNHHRAKYSNTNTRIFVEFQFKIALLRSHRVKWMHR